MNQNELNTKGKAVVDVIVNQDAQLKAYKRAIARIIGVIDTAKKEADGWQVELVNSLGNRIIDAIDAE